MNRDGEILHGLISWQYEHPLDRKALQVLNGTPGLEMVVRKFNQYALEKICKVQYTGSNVKVNEKNFPDVYEVFRQACLRLNLEREPDMYISWDYQINACTMGVENPIIVLNSGCVDLLEQGEMLFVIGHELGHIKSQHILYHQMARVLPLIGDLIGKATFGIGELLSTGLQLTLLHWARMSEFTADRAGLLACQNQDDAIRAFIKIAGVPQKYFNQALTEDFIAQAKEFEGYDFDSLERVAKIISILGQSHPWTVVRAAELISWVESGDYENIIDECKARKELENLVDRQALIESDNVI
jgi:Zn-dependent protease with chaperone function